MRRLKPSDFPADRGQQTWQHLPGQWLGEALKQIHAIPASVAAGNRLDLTSTLRTICQAVKGACEVDDAQLWLIEKTSEPMNATRWLALQAACGNSVEPTTTRLIALERDSVAARVLREQQGYFLNDLADEAPGTLVSVMFPKAAAALMVPLIAEGQALGILALLDKDAPERFTADDLDLAALFAGQVALAIQHAQLYDRLQAEHALAGKLAAAAQHYAGELETIFESMAEGVAVFDASGQIVRLNQAGEALGLSGAALLMVSPTLLGTKISEGAAGAESGLTRHPLVMRALAGEVVTGEQLIMVRGDGAHVYLQVSVAPLYDKQEQVTGAVAIMEDVTERQEYQREQLAAGWVAAALNYPIDLKETLDTAVEALTAALGADHSAILLADDAQSILKVASARGYAEEASASFPLLPLDAPVIPCAAFRTRKVQVSESSDGSASVEHPFQHMLIEQGIQASLAAPLLVQDQALGVLIYSYARPHHFSADEQQMARAIADQIALAVVNARLYEEVADYVAWQENERRTLQAVINALPAGVILRDKSGKLFMYNEAALRMALNEREVQADRQARQTTIEPIWEIIGPDGKPAPEAFLPSQLALQNRAPVKERQFFLRQSDERLVPILLNAAPVQDADGNFTRGVAVFQDITALKELERHKDEFISAASHELRGPLTVIRGQSQLLQRQLRRYEKQGELPPALLHIIESIDSIESQTARLNDLVNDLLDVSRIQAGKLTLQRGPVDVVPLLHKVVRHWQPASPDHALTLEAPTLAEGLTGHWDTKRVEQILHNLVGNAIKYSPEGGSVTIRAQVVGNKKQVLVGVQDEGMGIPPEAIPHLFERFYRAVNVSTISGTGLGLYISHQLAAAHGGDLWAESPGVAKGSTFYLRLPLE
jgi:PAS domain S-box-containing protein